MLFPRKRWRPRSFFVVVVSFSAAVLAPTKLPAGELFPEIRYTVGSGSVFRGESLSINGVMASVLPLSGATVALNFNEMFLTIESVELAPELAPLGKVTLNNESEQDNVSAKRGWALIQLQAPSQEALPLPADTSAFRLNFRAKEDPYAEDPNASGEGGAGSAIVVFTELNFETVGPGHENQVVILDEVPESRTLESASLEHGFIDVQVSRGRTQFTRGDANSDGTLDISDGVCILFDLFTGGCAIDCEAAADVNADLQINIADGVFLLNYLFRGDPHPPKPFPSCGTDFETPFPCEVFGPNCF